MTALLTSRNLAAAPTEAAQLGTPGIAVLLLGAFLPIVDFFIVNVALPTIDTTLHASAPSLELVVAGHGTVYAALLVVGGRLDDALGRRRVFVAGLIGFTLTSLLCGLAPSIGALIAFRLAQAAAAALIVPQVLGTFQSALDGPRRARALGLYGATAGISAVVGQVVGGLLVTANIAGTEWRPIFLVNVPVGLFGLAVVFRHVPATRSDRPTDRPASTCSAPCCSPRRWRPCSSRSPKGAPSAGRCGPGSSSPRRRSSARRPMSSSVAVSEPGRRRCCRRRCCASGRCAVASR